MALALHPNDPRVHVFELRNGPMRLARRTYLSGSEEGEGDTPLAQAFGAPVRPGHVEVFALEDVAPLSLRDYLAQAHDIPQEALAPDRARLDGASGRVAIVAPRAVEGIDALDPGPQLVHIGSYAPTGADDVPRDLPHATQPAAPPRRDTGPRRGPGRGTIFWIVLAALVLAVLAVLLF